jgi:hypothetical protein
VTNEVYRTIRTPDHSLKNFSFVTDVAVDKRAAFGCPAVAEQTRRHASEAALPLGDDWPPRSAGAAGPRHKHDGWPPAALVVVNISAPVFDHDIFNRSLITASTASPGGDSRMAEQTAIRRSAIRVVAFGEMNAFSVW